MRKLVPARVSYRDDFLILYRVYLMTRSFHISLLESTLHVYKIHMWFKIANITHALPVPVYRQTDFTPKLVVVSRLHDTVARFRTGVKFLPGNNNRGELTPRWLAPAWHFVVVSCKQMQSHEREPKWTRSGAKVATPCHVNTPLICFSLQGGGVLAPGFLRQPHVLFTAASRVSSVKLRKLWTHEKFQECWLCGDQSQ